MKNKFFAIVFAFLSLFSFANAQETTTKIFMFGREDCNFCHSEEVFLKKLLLERKDFEVVYFDVNDIESKQKFNQITEKYNLTKATPITLVGTSIIQGFNSEETTGAFISSKLDSLTNSKQIFTFESYFDSTLEGVGLTQTNFTCGGEEGSTSCSINVSPETEIKIPFIGVVDFKGFSIFSIAVILGFVDGFNPCAMWVLLAFLLVLWQIKDKKKMFQVAGLFIFSEAVMYWVILNFWFKAWDFVGLDKIVTPLVGILAIGGGIYFLYRYSKTEII